MSNKEVRRCLSELAQLINSFLVNTQARLPTRSQWARMQMLLNTALQLQRELRRVKAKAKGGKGVCRFCGCTMADACVYEGYMGEEVCCHWIDKSETVCSNPDCVEKFKAAKAGTA